MKELMSRISGLNIGTIGQHGIIPKRLKEKAVDYLWENYNPYYVKTEETTKIQTEKIDNFQFEIKVDKVVVAKSEFSGNIFPPKVRYQVDIKSMISSIISEIRNGLTQKNYTTKYAEVEL